ncbi:MAG: HEAT repeat domain-containing protein [archaeon]|nr:HEAT repeat domain-containing protein [archaeon]
MSRAVIQPFEEYQRSRIIFVQTVAALAGGKDNRNVELLKRLDAIRLLGPLLSDPVISIKQYAALAIGTLAGADEEIATQVVKDDGGQILKLILKSLETSNRFYKKTACRLLGKLSQWKSLAAEVVKETPGEVGVLNFLVSCLEDCNTEVKQFAANALQKICMNGADLARSVIDAQAIEPLSLCLQEPDIHLKRQAVLTLSSIVKHSREHTNIVCDKNETLNIILHYVQTKDTMLRRQVLLCLSYIAQNSGEKAIVIIGTLNNQILEENIGGSEKVSAFNMMQGNADIKGADPVCQQNALTLLYNIAKHGPSQTTQVSAKIKCETLIKFLETNKGIARNAGLQVLSTLVQHSKEQCQQIIRLNGHKVIALCLCESKPSTIRYACEAIGFMAGKAEPDITNNLVENLAIGVDENVRYYNIPYILLELTLNKNAEQPLLDASYKALENIITNNTNLDALKLLLDRPNFDAVDDSKYEKILCLVVRRINELLGEFKGYKKKLIEDMTLKKLIKMKSRYKIEDELKAFAEHYSPEIMNYYSDEYEEKIKEQVRQSLQ